MKKALSSLGPRLLSKRPPPVIVPWTAHAWGARAMAWMPRSMADNAVSGVTMDLRKKKRQSSKASNDKVASSAPAESKQAHDAGTTTATTTPHTHDEGSASDETAAEHAQK